MIKLNLKFTLTEKLPNDISELKRERGNEGWNF